MDKTKSIVTDYGSICFFCGKQAEGEHHLLFGEVRRAEKSNTNRYYTNKTDVLEGIGKGRRKNKTEQV